MTRFELLGAPIGYGWKSWYGLWECQATSEAYDQERQVVEQIRNGRMPVTVSGSVWDDHASIYECAVTDAWDPVRCVQRAQKRSQRRTPADPKRRAPQRRKHWIPQ